MEADNTPLRRWFQRVVHLEEYQPGQPATKRRALLIVAIFAIILLDWALCSVYLSRITVGTVNVAGRASNATLSKIIDKQAAAYQLTIKQPDGAKKQYSLEQLGLAIDTQKSILQTRQQQTFFHRLTWWQPIEASIVLTVDKATFNKFIATETSVAVQPPQDAVLSIEDGEIKITDAVVGKQHRLGWPKGTLLSSAKSLHPSTIELKTVTINPPLTERILAPYKSSLERTINQPVSFKIDGETITPTPAEIAAWLEITPDNKGKKVDITVNSGKVQEYIDNAAGAYIRPAKAQVETQQPDGSRKVLVAGVNGIDVTNKDATATKVAKRLLEGEGLNLPLTVSYESFQTITTGSYGKWIEVDLTHKRLYAYERDTLVKTNLVSAGAPETPTVTGQYSIYAKFDQQDMRGNNVDGSRYFQPHVRWINYFYRDYAIHGNYWRPTSYFGNINSSHGCVSMPDSEAEWIYTWAPIGTPVIVHT